MTGCTSASPSPSRAPDTSQEPAQTNEPEANGPAPVATLVPESQGANAGPQAPSQGLQGIYDPSQLAYDNFYSWWVYEVQTPQDWQESFEQTIYPLGVSTCGHLALGKRPSVIAAKIATENGLTGSAGQAIVVGAMKALCTKYDTGYKSYFDKNVDAFAVMVQQDLAFSDPKPTRVDFGYFMKEVCWYFTYDRGVRSEAPAAMSALRNVRYLPNVLTTRDTMWTAINDAISAGCSGY